MTIKVLLDSIFKVAISISLSSFLIGCGGGGGGSTASTDTGTTTTTSATDVTVERGPLLRATVTDANGQVATAKSANSNVYTFATTPVYPITAKNGYIDLDGDGAITSADVAFTGELKSYSTVVTPITTYISKGATETERTAKLAELKVKLGGTVSNDDLLKLPSEATDDIIALTNAIYDSYSVLFDTDATNDDVTSITTLDDRLTRYKSTITQSGTGKSGKELARLVEEELMIEKGVLTLTRDDVDKMNNSSSNNNDETDQESNSSSSPTVIALPSQFTINNGRLLGSQCAQCHGTNGVSSSGIDSIKGEDNLTHEIYDDDPLMNAQAKGYTSIEIIAIETWLNNIQ